MTKFFKRYGKSHVSAEYVSEVSAGKDHVFKGTNRNDFIEGTGGADKIYGLSGDDNLYGSFGSDVLYGGVGNDELDGGNSGDTLYGGSGDDELQGSNGDLLIGDAGNDLFLTSSSATAKGGTGDDVFAVLGHHADIDGGSGVDTVLFDMRSSSFAITYDGDTLLLKDISPSGLNGSSVRLTTEVDDSIERIVFKDLQIDRTHVTKPTITSVYAEGGRTSGDDTVYGAISTIRGTSDPFARIVIRVDGKIVSSRMADENGDWSAYALGLDLSQASHEITATADFGIKGRSRTSGIHTVEVAKYIDVDDLSAKEGVTLRPEAATGTLGTMISRLGDINGDGIDDLLVGGGYNVSAYVIYGRDGNLGEVTRNKAQFSLADMEPEAGFLLDWKLDGPSLIQSATTVGDFNGDGINDFLLGSSAVGNGMATIVYGVKGIRGEDDGNGHALLDCSDLTSAQAISIIGTNRSPIDGVAMTGIGDINGDGFDDLSIGLPTFRLNGSTVGQTCVIFGSDQQLGTPASGPSTLSLAEITPDKGFFVRGNEGINYSGLQVSAAGDVNGDGLADLLVAGAPTSNATDDEIFVLFGKSTGFGTVINNQSVVDLADMGLDEGFRIKGLDRKDNTTQSKISEIGDFNGDGYDDILIGDSQETKKDSGVLGHAYVIFGTADGFGRVENGVHTLDLEDMDADEGFTMSYGQDKTRKISRNVAPAGDFNGDGLDDILVVSGSNVSVVYGSRAPLGTDTGHGRLVNLANLGATGGLMVHGNVALKVSSAGDVNSDGYDDVIMGYFSTSHQGGISQIIYGGNFTSSAVVDRTGTAASEVLIGGAGNDILDGKGGADVFRSGAGDDSITIGDAGVRKIEAGRGTDSVLFGGAAIDVDLRDYTGSQMRGIERFDLTGTGANSLVLGAADVLCLSARGNALFSAAESRHNLVIDGNSGDELMLLDYLSSGASWELDHRDVGLDGVSGGTYDIYNLARSSDGFIFASVAVDSDITVM